MVTLTSPSLPVPGFCVTLQVQPDWVFVLAAYFASAARALQYAGRALLQRSCFDTIAMISLFFYFAARANNQCCASIVTPVALMLFLVLQEQ